MTNILQNEYHPDYVSSPGETLLETLETTGFEILVLCKYRATLQLLLSWSANPPLPLLTGSRRA